MNGSEKMICCYNIGIPMRDGVILRADLYLPDEEKRYPALLIRTVFRKKLMSRAFGQYDPSFFTKHGYAVVIQDVRGLGESDGEFDRFTADGPDGYDTIEWLAEQEWCDGKIGMMGNYFAGYLQLMAAAENPPHLKAICPMQTSVSINRDCDNRGFLFASHIGWCTSRLINRLMDKRYDADTTCRYLPVLQDAIHHYITDQVSVVPLKNMPLLNETPFEIYQKYYDHLVDGYDDFALMKKEGRNIDVSTIKTPAFYIGGWYDSSKTPMIAHCMAQKEAGVDSRVLIAPWKPGEAPARADSALEDGIVRVDIQEEMVNWFDRHVKGKKTEEADSVIYYDISSDKVFSGKTWPPESIMQTVYLSGSSLIMNEPEETGTVNYTLDSEKPLNYLPFGICSIGKTDENRAICLSEPLAKEMIICGMAKVHVCFSTDTPDTDVMCSLFDMDSKGNSFIICDGATRARYRSGWNSCLLENGKKYGMDVLLGNVMYTVKPGHRMGLMIYGSAFPKYDVNHCTGERPADDAKRLCSHVTIYTGGNDNFSCVFLPTLRNAEDSQHIAK